MIACKLIASLLAIVSVSVAHAGEGIDRIHAAILDNSTWKPSTKSLIPEGAKVYEVMGGGEISFETDAVGQKRVRLVIDSQDMLERGNGVHALLLLRLAGGEPGSEGYRYNSQCHDRLRSKEQPDFVVYAGGFLHVRRSGRWHIYDFYEAAPPLSSAGPPPSALELSIFDE